MQRISRKDFVKSMAIGGATFLGSPWTNQVFADQGLAKEAQRQGFGDPEVGKGALTNWGRLKFNSEHSEQSWHVHPQGDINLIGEINFDLSTNVSETWYVADVAHLDQMTKFPLLFMHSESPPVLTAAEMDNLREYLLRGGFLYAEDCVIGYQSHRSRSNNNDFFFRRMAQVLPQLLPEAQFVRLPLDHPIYSSYYSLTQGQPHMQGTEHGGHGLIHQGRLLAYLSPSDAHCAWSNEQWFSRSKTQSALKMGVNVYLFAMMQ
ncbi:MAG: DUF4159 domain-containing protein [Verrucomicrobiota bacterium]